MTKRDAQAAEYAEEQVQVAAARQMESQIVGTWQARQRARAKSRDAVDRLVEVSGWSLMSTPAREAVLEAAAEIERLRFAIRRLAEQDATLSVCEGDVTVTVDATLTDAERDDHRVWLAECLRQASTATEGGNEELAERWLGRSRRAAALLERLG